MHTLSDELQSLPAGTATDAARLQALRLERRELLSVHRELLVALYVAVATLVAGVGLWRGRPVRTGTGSSSSARGTG